MPRSTDCGLVEVPIRRDPALQVFPPGRYGPQRVAQTVSATSENALWSADAVRDLADEKRYVGAEVGILAVLHTWTGRLHHHPHVHMLVTGGGVTEDRTAWHDAPNEFLVPVKRLSPVIARRFAEALQKGHPDLFKQIPAMG